jgi:molecular chaperone DnaK
MAGDNRSLGQFKLAGIPVAPRGIPQIEVTFDIDANGILKVSAKDRGTGKEQTITISGSTSLDTGEIDRMVSEAEANSAEDKKRRQEVEAKNEADTLVYQVEKQLRDLGDKVPVHEKARIEQLINDLRTALKENAPVERIRNLQNDLQQAAHAVSQAAYQQPGQEAHQQAGCAGGGCAGGACGDNDVIDAEYEVK